MESQNTAAMASEGTVLDNAIADNLNSDADRGELLQFLRYQRKNGPTEEIIPIEGLEIKLGLVTNIIRKESKMLDKIQFAYLIRLSSDDLQSVSSSESGLSSLTWGSQAYSNLRPLTDYCKYNLHKETDFPTTIPVSNPEVT
ncbi:hypothetical protein FIE12Z_3886 [Fusarium flagelliforme]|uniref:Uncharacterized protein n=1 Tax=Fusarium flagelliforme TaxID=2675880 RepID=A0A395MVB6_9HYPO|nr:hypothetical protein FIE12Z_3886 [Fusarium flagelliforme]